MYMDDLDWKKTQQLIPAIVQDANTHCVLMLGYMNQEALRITLESNYVTFYSRSRKKLWIKGETTGNKLKLNSMRMDCDKDTLLIMATPLGPTCHLGSTSCFAGDNITEWQFIKQLEEVISKRAQSKSEASYTSTLFRDGINRIAQKVGEEGVEVALAAVIEDDAAFCNEAADLLYHLMVLLKARNVGLTDVIAVLKGRHHNEG